MKNFDELKYYLALSQVAHIGPISARKLINYFGSASSVFKATMKQLVQVENFGDFRAKALRQFSNFDAIEKELEFIEQNNIVVNCIDDNSYPVRLKNCVDAPIVLFSKGNIPIDKHKIISIVGSRRNTEYGKQLIENLLHTISADKEVLIVSGLALGIDQLAHQHALDFGIQTLGVVAHGLRQIYPPQHKSLAQKMVEQGGAIVSEYFSDVQPDKENFPTRNRIVAGMCDVLLVVETEVRGGSMITVNLADGYNKDIATFPGRINDQMSKGCNYLIQQNKAHLISGATDLYELMNWGQEVEAPKQKSLFVELSADEEKLYQLIQNGCTYIDDLIANTDLNPSQLAANILNMELKYIIRSLPGKHYQIIG